MFGVRFAAIRFRRSRPTLRPGNVSRSIERSEFAADRSVTVRQPTWLRRWPSLRGMECGKTRGQGQACSKHYRGTTMGHYAGIDVSLESASLCVVDATGRIVCEVKVAGEHDVLIGWFGYLEFRVTRMGLEAGQLSQWLYAGMRDAGLAVELLET